MGIDAEIHVHLVFKGEIEGDTPGPARSKAESLVKDIEYRATAIGFEVKGCSIDIDAEIDPRIVAAIKDRDARTDRWGEDLVFQVLHDLKDREYVHQWMPEHKEGCRLFAALSEDRQFHILRRVLNEPEP